MGGSAARCRLPSASAAHAPPRAAPPGPSVPAAPAVQSKLANLQYLNADHNCLLSLPDSVTQLVFARMPPFKNALEIRNLPMEVLQRPRRRTPDAPRAARRAPLWQVSLTELSAEANRITQLPPGIAGLSNLTRINVAGNPIARLPIEFGALRSSLRRLDIDLPLEASLARAHSTRVARTHPRSVHPAPFVRSCRPRRSPTWASRSSCGTPLPCSTPLFIPPRDLSLRPTSCCVQNACQIW